MTYEAFKIAMTAEVVNQAGEEVDVRLHKIAKNNGVVVDAMTVMKKNGHVAPTVYLKDFYMQYKDGASMKEIAEEILRISLTNPVEKILPAGFFAEYESVKERICFKVINYEKNVEFLKEVPHKRFLDLAMIFYYAVDPNILGHATVLVRNTDMLRWETQVEELLRMAMRNTPRLLPWRFVDIQHVVEELLFEGLEEALAAIEKACEIIQAEEDAVPMYILTNQEKYFGAACMLYPGLLSVIADKFESNLYILPSSIHECIIMPVSGWYTKEGLTEMVREINEREVEDVEVLADHVYVYDREEKEIRI